MCYQWKRFCSAEMNCMCAIHRHQKWSSYCKYLLQLDCRLIMHMTLYLYRKTAALLFTIWHCTCTGKRLLCRSQFDTVLVQENGCFAVHNLTLYLYRKTAALPFTIWHCTCTGKRLHCRSQFDTVLVQENGCFAIHNLTLYLYRKTAALPFTIWHCTCTGKRLHCCSQFLRRLTAWRTWSRLNFLIWSL